MGKRASLPFPPPRRHPLFLPASAFSHWRSGRWNSAFRPFSSATWPFYSARLAAGLRRMHIALEYCKVVEVQLLYHLQKYSLMKNNMLGMLIQCIDENNIQPINKYLDMLRDINNYRRSSAHTGIVDKSAVNQIRNILFDKDLLGKIQ